jgi:uncharacterized repeat protein (TIGR03803 family)
MLPKRKFRVTGIHGLAAAVLALAALYAGPARAAATLTLKTLYSFCAQTNCTDGTTPLAGLIADAAGNLFGATVLGGLNNSGTVFEIAKTASGYASSATILYRFCATNCLDGAQPNGLLADAAGDLFGTTYQAGQAGDDSGTVFELTKTASGYVSPATTLYSFCSQGGVNCTDGGTPLAGLIFDNVGNLFGTTHCCGANGQGGTVFELTKTASGYVSPATILYSFCAQTKCADGAFPVAGLLADATGNLFGTTQFGGANGQGTVFKIANTASGYVSPATILYSFCAQSNCPDGAQPVAGLIFDNVGNLFGTTQYGGANNAGTVFELAKSASGYAATILYSFCAQTKCPDGAFPVAGLLADATGNVFGTTQYGGLTGWGTVFELAKTASGYASAPTILYSFCAQTNCPDGSQPVAALLADAAGDMFGTTREGGASGAGTVFELARGGFIPPGLFVGTPGTTPAAIEACINATVSGLAHEGGIGNVARALGLSVMSLQSAITQFCSG